MSGYTECGQKKEPSGDPSSTDESGKHCAQPQEAIGYDPPIQNVCKGPIHRDRDGTGGHRRLGGRRLLTGAGVSLGSRTEVGPAWPCERPECHRIDHFEMAHLMSHEIHFKNRERVKRLTP